MLESFETDELARAFRVSQDLLARFRYIFPTPHGPLERTNGKSLNALLFYWKECKTPEQNLVSVQRIIGNPLHGLGMQTT